MFIEKMTVIKLNFDNNRGSVDNLESVLSLFFIPFNTLFLELMNGGLRDNVIITLALKTSKGIEAYDSISSGYSKFEQEMILIAKEMGRNLSKLKENSKRLLSSIYANV